MLGRNLLRVLMLGILQSFVDCVSISFDSGEAFTPIDPSSIDASNFVDPVGTASYLFLSDSDFDRKALSLSILIEHFRSTSSDYFRSHPKFVTCLQTTLSSLRKQEIRAEIVSAFKTNSDVPASTKLQHLYARAGTGAILKFRPGVLGDIKDIARTAIISCASIFATIQRDVGIVMLMDSVHIHMTGEVDTYPRFSVDGYTGGMDDAAFDTYARGILGESQDPTVLPLDCSTFDMVANGAWFPDWTTDPGDIVGDPDVPILRYNTGDFSKLMQFIGTNVEFVNHERTASWCGEEGHPCVDCRAGIVGSALTERCAARTMSYRMHQVINTLQMFVRYNMSFTDTLKVVKAWDEPYSGNPNGDLSYSRLHTEGRAVVVQLVSANTVNNLRELSQFAICSGADYVAHNGDNLQIAVKKMSGTTAHSVTFGQATLIAVDPPSVNLEEYDFPAEFNEDDKENYPLFYGKGRGLLSLNENAPLDKFMSSDDYYQYFRLNPSIPACYSKLLSKVAPLEVDIIRGYLANPEQVSLFSQSTDDRYNTHNLGVALQLKYTNETSSSYTPGHLLEEVIKACGPVFNMADEMIGLGLYSDSVFVDMRDLFEVWVESDSLIPYANMDKNAYEDYLETIYTAAIEGRIVDPDDPVEACNLAVIPMKPSPTYRYQLPEIIKRRRRRRAVTESCVPQADTEFCQSTVGNRDSEVELVWADMNRKHIYHDPVSELEDAVKGCLLDCGTCLEGYIYEEKHKHCSNMVHWMPYSFMNEDDGVTNFFSLDSIWGKQMACYTPGHHCLHKAPAFAKLGPTAYRVYRPDINRAPEEQLYSNEDNPSQMIAILQETYAMIAKGQVSFWVEDEIDMTAMEVPFKTVMMYNPNATLVAIYVKTAVKIGPVGEVVEGFILEMATTGCTLYTRKVLAPYSISTTPESHVVKRAAVDTGKQEWGQKIMIQWQRRDTYDFINTEGP